MLEILIRRAIPKALEWLGGGPELVANLRGATKRQLYDALASLNADRELLGTVGSWLDTWTDVEVLTALREWNSAAAADALEAAREGHGAIKPAAKS
jgi:hypothetical protein